MIHDVIFNLFTINLLKMTYYILFCTFTLLSSYNNNLQYNECFLMLTLNYIHFMTI